MKMYYDSVQPTCAAWPKAVSQLFGFFLPLMNRQFGVSQDSGGFKTAAVRGIAYIGLEKSCLGDVSNMPRSPHYEWSTLGAVPQGFFCTDLC